MAVICKIGQQFKAHSSCIGRENCALIVPLENMILANLGTVQRNRCPFGRPATCQDCAKIQYCPYDERNSPENCNQYRAGEAHREIPCHR